MLISMPYFFAIRVACFCAFSSNFASLSGSELSLTLLIKLLIYSRILVTVKGEEPAFSKASCADTILKNASTASVVVIEELDISLICPMAVDEDKYRAALSFDLSHNNAPLNYSSNRKVVIKRRIFS